MDSEGKPTRELWSSANERKERREVKTGSNLKAHFTIERKEAEGKREEGTRIVTKGNASCREYR